MTIPAYLPYFVFAGTAAHRRHHPLRTESRARRGRLGRARARADVGASAAYPDWLACAAIALGAMGAYHVDADALPTIQYGIVLPILIGALLIWRSESVARLIDAVPQQWLVGVQLYRALGVIFLILYATGKLPGLFAWPAGVGDIAIGLLAPIVALAYARVPREAAAS